MEFIFDSHGYSEERNVKLDVTQFVDYAIIWCDQLIPSRRKNYERPIGTWDELRAIMRKPHAPSHYFRYRNDRHERGFREDHRRCDGVEKSMRGRGKGKIPI